MDRPDIKASLEGDGEAYRRLVQRHQRQMAVIMWRFSRDKAVCQELVQAVFVQAYFGLAKYRGYGSFGGWLSRIAVRTGYKYWKQQAKQNAHFQLSEVDRVEYPVDGQAMDAEVAGRTVHELLARLPATDRLVLTLMYFEDMGTEQIAQQMGWTRAMVKMRAYRARRKLRTIAEREGLREKLGWIR